MRRFVQMSPAERVGLNQLGNNPVVTIVFGDYPQEEEPAPPFEMTMTWYRGDLFPKLEYLHDAFLLFENFSDVFTELSKRSDQPLTPQEFCTLLNKLDFRDETPEIPWQEIKITLQPNKYSLART
jgi:hypothetical protein